MFAEEEGTAVRRGRNGIVNLTKRGTEQIIRQAILYGFVRDPVPLVIQIYIILIADVVKHVGILRALAYQNPNVLIGMDRIPI